MPLHNPKRRPSLTKHRPQIAHERLRLLVRGKVPALVVLGLEDEVAEALHPPARHLLELFGETNESKRDRRPFNIVVDVVRS